MKRLVVAAVVLAGARALAQVPADAPAPDAPAPDARPADAGVPDAPPEPPLDLPPLPPNPPPLPPPPPDVPPPLDRPVMGEGELVRPPPEPSNLRHAFHFGMTAGLEVAQGGDSAYALGGGAQLSWELFWPRIALEFAVAVEGHGDGATMDNEGFWEAHPMAYAKLPLADGVWEVLAGWGASPASLHDGDLAPATTYHVLELGVEDRTKNWYSRLFVRWYVPFGGDFANPTAIVGASVGFFHLGKHR